MKCIPDCYFREDENYSACHLNDSNRYICVSNSSKCLSFVAVGNLAKDCPNLEDELVSFERIRVQRLPFVYLCNTESEILSLIIGQNDEIYCEEWPYYTPYVQCDRQWNYHNGIDELNCPDTNCSQNEHYCQLLDTSTVLCLSIEYLFEKYINNCPRNKSLIYREIYFNNMTNINMWSVIIGKDDEWTGYCSTENEKSLVIKETDLKWNILINKQCSS